MTFLLPNCMLSVSISNIRESLMHILAIGFIQVTKVGFFFSEILNIIFDVPKGSILGPLLFNINKIDLFLMEQYKSDFSYYADDTTLYNCGNTFFEAISDLETTIDNLFDWFCYNNLKTNPSKCHLFLSYFNSKSININRKKL